MAGLIRSATSVQFVAALISAVVSKQVWVSVLEAQCAPGLPAHPDIWRDSVFHWQGSCQAPQVRCCCVRHPALMVLRCTVSRLPSTVSAQKHSALLECLGIWLPKEAGQWAPGTVFHCFGVSTGCAVSAASTKFLGKPCSSEGILQFYRHEQPETCTSRSLPSVSSYL